MPEYLAPGVFVEEVSYRAKSIEGVSTTTTGFVGATLYGPIAIEPEIITSLVEFERIYGGRSPLMFDDIGRVDNYMWNAVRAFFEEGGKRLYVARAFNRGLVANQEQAVIDAARSKVVDPFPPANVAIEARYPGKAGDARVRLQFFASQNRLAFDGPLVTLGSSGHRDIVAVNNVTIGGNPRAGLYTLLRNSQADTWTFDDGNGVTFELQEIGGGNPVASVKTVTATVFVEPQTQGLPFYAATELALDRGHAVAGKPDSIFDYFTQTPDSPSAYRGNPIIVRALTAPEATAQKTAATSARTAAQTVNTGAQTALGLADQAVANAQTALTTANAALSTPPTAPEQQAVATAQTALDTATTAREPVLQAALTAADSLANAQALVAQANAQLSAANNNVAQDGLRFLKSFIAPNPAPQRFTLVQLAANTGDAPLLDATYLLTGGNDGDVPVVDTYAGGQDSTELKHGLLAFEDIEDISIVAAPGSSFRTNEAQGVALALIAHARNMKYRIAVIDSIRGATIAEVRAYRGKFDSNYAAFYYPWVRIIDPVTNQENHYPPSGFVSGIYARNDIERAVYKAPANETVNLAIGFEKLINKGQQEVLNPEGINCFRYFEGRGMRLWGARTMTSDPEWKYVNLRRYFAYLERSIDKGTQWAVFEPNGEKLWANVRRTIEDFLLNEWQNGALLGEKPDRSYFVKCDRSTMTQNDLDNGRLVCQVGVAPLRPAEFVIFRVGQWTADRKA